LAGLKARPTLRGGPESLPYGNGGGGGMLVRT